MKKLILATLALPLLIACNQEIKEENARLKSENEQLKLESEQNDSLISDYGESYQVIQNNLDSIRAKEDRIEALRDGGIEYDGDRAEAILKDIEAINELLTENRGTIANLNDKVKRYQYENGKFKKMIDNLQDQVAEKDTAIKVLKGNLASLNLKVGQLNTKLKDAGEQNRQQRKIIAKQTEIITTAYYIVGDYDNLKADNIVTKKGGVIGMGRTKTLSDDFNKDKFTRIDITKTQVIPVAAPKKDVTLLSSHDSDSYKWNMSDEKTVSSLEITDINKFWKSSKYLVIMTD